MTKVCHITCVHGGNDLRIFRKECTALARAGYEVYLVAPGASYMQNGVHIVGIGDAPASRWKRMTTFAHKAYRAARELNCDIYQIHDPELLPYALRLLRRGKKVIYDSHESYAAQIAAKEYLPRILKNTVAALYRAYETRVVGQIDAALIPCTFHGTNIFAGRARRAEIIANYPIMDDRLCEATMRAAPGAYVCYAGALSPVRGTTQLILAAHTVGVRLVLAGRFSSAEYQREVEAMPAFSNVDYRGVVDSAQVVDIYRGALAGMCTLLPYGQYYAIDTLATKVYEYWMAGLPVVLSDAPYNKAVIEKYHSGVCVDPADVQAIADAITYLTAHPDEARQMGENGRRAVLAEFNWGMEEQKLLALYKELERESNVRR